MRWFLLPLLLLSLGVVFLPTGCKKQQAQQHKKGDGHDHKEHKEGDGHKDHKKAGDDHKEHAKGYICPMACEKFKIYAKEGKCPKCGMKLKEVHKVLKPKGYICPMACEKFKVYAKEGKCPKCGMKLKEVHEVLKSKG